MKYQVELELIYTDSYRGQQNYIILSLESNKQVLAKNSHGDYFTINAEELHYLSEREVITFVDWDLIYGKTLWKIKSIQTTEV